MMTQHFEVLVFCFVLALTDSCVIRVMTRQVGEYLLTVEASGVVDARDRKPYTEERS